MGTCFLLNCSDIQITGDPKLQHVDDSAESSGSAVLLNNAYKGENHQGFLRARWQIEGYLNTQADLLEK